MQHDGWFFIGVFAFIFLVWAATGGPTHPLSFSGPLLSQPGPLGGGTYLSLPHSPFGIGTSNVTLSGTSNGSSYSGSQTPKTVEGVAFGPPSNYRGQISTSHYVSGTGSSNPGNEYLSISLAQDASAPVTISGWTLESEATGNAAVIPGGADVPRSGYLNEGAPITLRPGDQAYVISGRSPIGASFRENKCMGYFSQFQQFSPSLPNSCPTPDSELQAYYGPSYVRDAKCIDYINTLSRCQAVLSPPVSISGACSTFVTQYLNYNGCVTAHENDANFKGNTWRIYLGRTTAMWRTSHEVVKLVDTQGKTVDAFSY